MIRLGIAVALLGVSSLFWIAYYTQYFKWRHCFNDLGRCYDPETGVVFLEQAGFVWSLMAVLTLAASIYLFWAHRRNRRRARH